MVEDYNSIIQIRSRRIRYTEKDRRLTPQKQYDTPDSVEDRYKDESPSRFWTAQEESYSNAMVDGRTGYGLLPNFGIPTVQDRYRRAA